MKDLNEWTRAEFDALPTRDWREEVICRSLVLLPLRRRHDSGYRVMDFALIGKDRQCLSGPCSDVVHINGIGGYGEYRGRIPDLIKPVNFSIDCLATSGLLRLFCHGEIKVDTALSSLCVYALEREKETA